MNIAGTRWAGYTLPPFPHPGTEYIEFLFGEDGRCTLKTADGVSPTGIWRLFETPTVNRLPGLKISCVLNGKHSEWIGTVYHLGGVNVRGNVTIFPYEEIRSWVLEKYEEGSLTPPEILWRSRLQGLEFIRDSLGLPLDPGIQRSVLAVQLMGLETLWSCEGHTNWGHTGPSITFRRDGIFREIRDDIKRQWLDSFYKDRHFDSDLAICPENFMRGDISSINHGASDSLPLKEKEEFLKASRQEMSDFTDFVLYTLFEGKIPQVIQDLPQLTERPLTIER